MAMMDGIVTIALKLITVEPGYVHNFWNLGRGYAHTRGMHKRRVCLKGTKSPGMCLTYAY
jgi:hypothetical protein